MEGASREVWAKRVERWVDSGLTAKEFAAEMGINPRTLTYWKWRLGKDRAEGRRRPSSRSGARRKGQRRSRRPTPTFVEVTPVKSAEDVSARALELAVGRYTVRVANGFGPETLTQLLDVLEARS